MSEQINIAIDKLEGWRSRLPDIADPEEVLSGTIDVDVQLHLLGKALNELTKLIVIAGTEAARLKAVYYKKKYDLSIQYTEKALKELSIVKSNKFEFIKSSLYKEMQELDEMIEKRKFFQNQMDSYKEIIMVYKKTRIMPVE